MSTLLEYAGFSVATNSDGLSIKLDPGRDKMSQPIFSINFQQNYFFGQLLAGTVAMIQGDRGYETLCGNFDSPRMPILENVLYCLRSYPREAAE